MGVVEILDGGLDLGGALLAVPAEDLGHGVAELGEHGCGHSADEGQIGSAQQDVADVHGLLRLDHVAKLGGRESAGGQRGVGTGGDRCDDLAGAGAVTGEQLIGAVGGYVAASAGHPCSTLRVGGRVVAAAADGQSDGRDLSGSAEQLHDAIRQLLAEGAERGPLTADQAQHRNRNPGQLSAFDVVVARDEARRRVVVAGQRADAGERVHDVVAGDGDIREHMLDEIEEVVDLVVGAPRRRARVGVDVGGAHQDSILERVDQHDATVGVLEEDLAPTSGLDEVGVIENDVRSLGAAHVSGVAAECVVGEVGPRTTGVHDDLGRHGELFTADTICEHHLAVANRDGFDMVGRTGVRSGGKAVLEDVECQALGIVYRGVEIGCGVTNAGVQSRHVGAGLVACAELVTRHPALTRAGEGVVHDQSGLDQRRAALVGLTGVVREKTPRRVQDSAERREDGDGGLEGLHVVGCDLEQAVALVHRLSDEPELAVLQIADAAVDHVARRRRRAADPIVALDEHDVDALKCEVAEGGDAVDAATDDEDLCRRALGERRDAWPERCGRGGVFGHDSILMVTAHKSNSSAHMCKGGFCW